MPGNKGPEVDKTSEQPPLRPVSRSDDQLLELFRELGRTAIIAASTRDNTTGGLPGFITQLAIAKNEPSDHPKANPTITDGMPSAIKEGLPLKIVIDGAESED